MATHFIPLNCQTRAQFALNSELLTVAYRNEDNLIELETLNRVTSSCHTLITTIPCVSEAEFLIEFFQDDLTLIVSTTASYYSHHICPRQLLPYSKFSQSLPSLCVVGTTISRIPIISQILYLYVSRVTGIMVEVSETLHFGVSGAPDSRGTLIVIYDPRTRFSTQLALSMGANVDGVGKYGCFSPSNSWCSTFLPILQDDLGMTEWIYLLRYDSEDLFGSFRPLSLPENMKLDHCLTCDIDEGRGEVTMFTGPRTLSRFSFVAQSS